MSFQPTIIYHLSACKLPLWHLWRCRIVPTSLTYQTWLMHHTSCTCESYDPYMYTCGQGYYMCMIPPISPILPSNRPVGPMGLRTWLPWRDYLDVVTLTWLSSRGYLDVITSWSILPPGGWAYTLTPDTPGHVDRTWLMYRKTSRKWHCPVRVKGGYRSRYFHYFLISRFFSLYIFRFLWSSRYDRWIHRFVCICSNWLVVIRIVFTYKQMWNVWRMNKYIMRCPFPW